MEFTTLVRLIIFITGYTLIILSTLPLVRNDHWFFRMLDYPRSQKFWFNAIILLMFMFIVVWDNAHDVIFMTLLSLNQLYLFSVIWNYTPLTSVQMKKHKGRNEGIKLYIANVLQDNRNYSLCKESIKRHDPDIVLLVETDDQWCNEMQRSLKDYSYSVLKPLNNTYGMVLFSKLEILHHSIRFLVTSDVPSIMADLKTNEGKTFRLYGLHPKPPVPPKEKDSSERDAEILIVGKESKKCAMPVIVAGDLNDVAWSYTTSLFLKISGLLDPRIGRGFFSTFHAKYKLFRWPLDHVFCSSHFYLNRLKRLSSIGSDHFPIFIDVSLMSFKTQEQKAAEETPDEEDLRVAEKKINQEG